MHRVCSGLRSIRPRDGVIWVLQRERLADTQDGVSTWLDATSIAIRGGATVKHEVRIQLAHDVHKPTIAVVERGRALLKGSRHTIHSRGTNLPFVVLHIRLIVAIVRPIVHEIRVLVSCDGVKLNERPLFANESVFQQGLRHGRHRHLVGCFPTTISDGHHQSRRAVLGPSVVVLGHIVVARIRPIDGRRPSRIGDECRQIKDVVATHPNLIILAQLDGRNVADLHFITRLDAAFVLGEAEFVQPKFRCRPHRVEGVEAGKCVVAQVRRLLPRPQSRLHLTQRWAVEQQARGQVVESCA